MLLFGAAVAALAWAWQFESVPPDLMEHLSVAAGLRPPSGATSLLWQYIAGPLCRNCGIAKAETVLRVAGHVSLGVLAVLTLMLFEKLVPASLRRGWLPQTPRRTRMPRGSAPEPSRPAPYRASQCKIPSGIPSGRRIQYRHCCRYCAGKLPAGAPAYAVLSGPGTRRHSASSSAGHR